MVNEKIAWTYLNNGANEQAESERNAGNVAAGATDGDASRHTDRGQQERAQQLSQQLPPDHLVVRHVGQPEE